MDCRILPRYSLDMVRSEVSKRVAEVEAKYGVKVADVGGDGKVSETKNTIFTRKIICKSTP